MVIGTLRKNLLPLKISERQEEKEKEKGLVDGEEKESKREKKF